MKNQKIDTSWVGIIRRRAMRRMLLIALGMGGAAAAVQGPAIVSAAQSAAQGLF